MKMDRQQRLEFRPRRRGIAVVIVLALLSITLAMSYAMMRTQMSAAQIERNLHRAGSARHAALSGLAIGVRKMHAANWQGVGVSVNGSLSDNESYIVTYETGDAKLTAADPDWGEYPYRVTVRAIGIAFDPLDTTYKSEYVTEAVVQLVRKRRTDNPAHFTTSQAYTTYLWGTQANRIEMPISLNGPTHIQGELQLCQSMPVATRPFYGLIDELAIYDYDIGGLSLLLMALAGNSSNSSLYYQMNALGPRHWWRFNESSSTAATVAAQAGGRTGTYGGGTLPGVVVSGSNRATFFDGENGYVDLGKFELPSSGRFSIIAWIAPLNGDADNDQGRIISKSTGIDASDHTFMLGLDNGDSNPRLRARLHRSNYTYTYTASGGTLSFSQWACVALTFDGYQYRFYKNGILISTHGIGGSPVNNPAASVWIGDNPPGSPRTRYLGDLLSMKNAGRGDYRPLTGDIRLNQSTNSNANWLCLSRLLGLTVNYSNFSVTTPTEITAAASAYQLYPGGKSYSVPAIAGNISNRNYAPDMLDNPLGVLRINGNTTLGDSVTIDGMCITPGDGVDLTFRGDNVQVRATTLPALVGESSVWQLPAIYGRDDVLIDDADVTIDGAVIVGDRFEIEAGADETRCVLTGMLHAQRATVATRNSWDYHYSDWESQLSQFVNATGGDADDYFPQWLDDERGLDLNKNLSVSPPAETKSYYWPDLSQPIYVADPGDEGLVWEYIRRSENGPS
ncbi:LamG domain-containing protein [Blastopirellula sp. J2-11]|uniref:LamG domain-containing protein n=1 Tax=Blastopirellula sp. J2-11 TaxID=2943192 RepID=UPI0021CA5553|nr:LamG domain-containing protein [Blastopirellula sp. J2-11]UUO08870.1 LamG domain-containing protein [Blastopirellula sp. J2-11]